MRLLPTQMRMQKTSSHAGAMLQTLTATWLKSLEVCSCSLEHTYKPRTSCCSRVDISQPGPDNGTCPSDSSARHSTSTVRLLSQQLNFCHAQQYVYTVQFSPSYMYKRNDMHSKAANCLPHVYRSQQATSRSSTQPDMAHPYHQVAVLKRVIQSLDEGMMPWANNHK